ncbi:hypothetical protein [Apilactobacillus ozensis]|uniref:hypothetical protein n=1 Tax=Apilactobacillus ozensis TaxID=866801 RepID=UPI000AF4764D|nr:hypothetical protein [Apilactobacillus ozensis]
MESKNVLGVTLKITRNYYKIAAEILNKTEGKVGFEQSIDFARFQVLNQLIPNRLVGLKKSN